MAVQVAPDYTIPAIDRRIERIKLWKKLYAETLKETLEQQIVNAFFYIMKFTFVL